MQYHHERKSPGCIAHLTTTHTLSPSGYNQIMQHNRVPHCLKVYTGSLFCFNAPQQFTLLLNFQTPPQCYSTAQAVKSVRSASGTLHSLFTSQ
jgi:hypothetical protein